MPYSAMPEWFSWMQSNDVDRSLSFVSTVNGVLHPGEKSPDLRLVFFSGQTVACIIPGYVKQPEILPLRGPFKAQGENSGRKVKPGAAASEGTCFWDGKGQSFRFLSWPAGRLVGTFLFGRNVFPFLAGYFPGYGKRDGTSIFPFFLMSERTNSYGQ